MGESVAGIGDQINPAPIPAQTQPVQIQTVANNSTLPVVALAIPTSLTQPTESIDLNANNPQASSNLKNNFSDNISQDNNAQKITVPKARRTYMLVLIAPLAILLIIVTKLIKVKYGEEDK